MSTCSNCGKPLEAEVRFCPSCGTQAVAPGIEDSLLGRTFNDKYRVLAKIGSGSMGTVYLGEHIGLHKRVALKVLRPDLEVSEETLQRFQREGIAAGKFSHPNAIQIFDFDRADTRLFFLAMEYVEGPNLKEFLAAEGRVPASDAVELVRQILGALGEAHEHGIVHRDLKPENIMVIRGADVGLSVKVLDFGLSKLVHLPLGASMATQPGQIMGTPMYMAPEQGSGEEVDHRTDLYAVGLILYELLTGEPPFQGDTLTQLFVRQATERAPTASEAHPKLSIPPDLDDAISRSLEKAKEDRFQSAREMLDALERADLTAQPTVRMRRESLFPWRSSTKHPAPIKRPTDRAPRSRALPIAVLVLIIAGLGVLSISMLGGDTEASVSRVSLKSPDARSDEETRYVELLDGARRRLRTGDVSEALAQVVEAHDLPCRDAEAFLVRGLVYRAREDDDAASADFREALSVDPSYASAAAALGWVALDRGDLDSARSRFAEAVTLQGDSAEANAGLGAVAYERGETREARERLERAVNLDAEEPHASLYLGRMLLEDGDASAAVDALVRAKLNAPRSWEPYAALGDAYLELGRPQEAERQLREAVNLEPDAMDALTSLASLLVGNDRHADAISLVEPALRRHPSWGRPRVLLGVSLEAEGRLDEAISALQRAVDDGEDGVQVRTLLGIWYQRSGALTEAIEQYDAALEIDDELALPHKNRGLSLSGLDRFDEAAVELERALELDPDDVFAHYSLGVLYKDFLGGAEQALEHLRAYEQLGGSDVRVGGWIEELDG